jgi:hypothetical protein
MTLRLKRISLAGDATARRGSLGDCVSHRRLGERVDTVKPGPGPVRVHFLPKDRSREMSGWLGLITQSRYDHRAAT